jgi:hypothetical protein
MPEYCEHGQLGQPRGHGDRPWTLCKQFAVIKHEGQWWCDGCYDWCFTEKYPLHALPMCPGCAIGLGIGDWDSWREGAPLPFDF